MTRKVQCRSGLEATLSDRAILMALEFSPKQTKSVPIFFCLFKKL